MSNATRQLSSVKRGMSDDLNSGSGMSAGWWVASLGLGALIALVVVANAKDVARYIKISSM